MAKNWRHAVVGVGVVGEWHARVISQLLPGSTLVALCDTDPKKLPAVQQKLQLSTQVQLFTDETAMLEKLHDQIDVVHVCTPSGDHLRPVEIALEARKNVICEKPMEIQLDRIDRMTQLANRSGARLAGIFQNRWNPANRALKDAAEQGRFGTIAFAGCYTPWYRSDEYYRDGGWRGTWRLDGGGAMMNQSVHAVDLLQWIAGPIKTVTAHAASRIHPEIEVEDTLACSLQFASGAFGVIMGSTAMYPGGAVRLEIGGSNGTAVSEGGIKVFNFRQPRDSDSEMLQMKMNTSGGGTNPSDVPQWLHAENMKAILSAWESGKDPETSAAESRKAIAIILAMYESARKGGAPVTVG